MSPSDGSLLQTMWIERTTYITAYQFPGILKWFEVKSTSMVRRGFDAKTLIYDFQNSILTVLMRRRRSAP